MVLKLKMSVQLTSLYVNTIYQTEKNMKFRKIRDHTIKRCRVHTYGILRVMCIKIICTHRSIAITFIRIDHV